MSQQGFTIVSIISGEDEDLGLKEIVTRGQFSMVLDKSLGQTIKYGTGFTTVSAISPGTISVQVVYERNTVEGVGGTVIKAGANGANVIVSTHTEAYGSTGLLQINIYGYTSGQAVGRLIVAHVGQAVEVNYTVIQTPYLIELQPNEELRYRYEGKSGGTALIGGIGDVYLIDKI
jgi:hypothetical protein